MKNNVTSNTVINIYSTAPKVWDALTKPELIKQYFFGTDAISDWQEGSTVVFKGEWEGKAYEDKGIIRMIEPNKLFRYDYWSSMSGIEDKPENYQVITYELFEEEGITTLAITQENIKDEERKVHSEQNWRKVANDLKGLLESSLEPDPRTSTGN